MCTKEKSIIERPPPTAQTGCMGCVQSLARIRPCMYVRKVNATWVGESRWKRRG